MKLSRNAITMLKSAYQSVLLRGLVFGSAFFVSMPSYALTYTYTKIDGQIAYGDSKIPETPTSTKETISISEPHKVFFLSPSSQYWATPDDWSWATLNDHQYGPLESDNEFYLEPTYRSGHLDLPIFFIATGDSLDHTSSINLKGISTKSGRIRFDVLSSVNVNNVGIYGDLDAKFVTETVIRGYLKDVPGEHLKPNEPYDLHKVEFQKLVLDGTAINLNHKEAFLGAEEMILKNNAEGKVTSLKTNNLTVGSESDGSARLATQNLYAKNITIASPWNQSPSILAYTKFIANDDLSNNYDYCGIHGTFGNISIGQNAALVHGYASGVDSLQNAKDLIQGAGGISQNGIKAMMYLKSPNTFEIAENAGVTIDGNQKSPATFKDTLKIGSDSVIVLGREVTDLACLRSPETDSDWIISAISFENPGRVLYEDSSKILLDSSNIKVGSRFKLFDNATSTNISGSKQNLKVESVNGNFKTYLLHTDTSGITVKQEVKPEVDPEVKPEVDPEVKPKVEPEVKPEEGGITAPVVQTFTLVDYYNLSYPLYELLQYTLVNPFADGDGARYLRTVAGETFTGASEIEVAGRHHIYSGVYQSSLEGMNSADNAIASRVGLDLSYKRTFGLWFLPYYKHYESSDLRSGRTRYGLNTNLSGFSIGSDFCIKDKYRLGLMAHMGVARTLGKDIAKHTKGRNNYWGFGVYGSVFDKDYSIDGEIVYSHINNKADSDINLISYHTLKSQTKGDMLRVGLNTSLIYEFGNFRVLPYTGIKYTKLKLNNTDVYADNVKISEIHSSDLDAINIPVGVKINHIKTAGDWVVMPEVQAGISFNIKDTDATMRNTFIGAGTAELTAEIMNEFNYTLGFGLKLSYASSMDLSLGCSYTGSSDAEVYSLHMSGVYRF